MKVNYWASAVVVMAAKHFFSSATIAPARSQPAELLWVVNSLVHTSDPEEKEEDQCEQLVQYFADKIDRIWVGLDSGLEIVNPDSEHTLSGPFLWGELSLV